MALTDNSREFFRKVSRKIDTVQKVTGERFVAQARQTNTYKDQTANLRNSIGYMVLSSEGRSDDFGGGEGGAKGRSLASSQLDMNTIVMAAGMEYGAAVEAKGYDVISNSVNQAKRNYDRLIKKALKV